MSQNVLTNRHDFLLLFEVTNGNPNGDPDAGNMPRLDPNTNRGIVSDVCLKRKVRNYVFEAMRNATGEPLDGHKIFIQHSHYLNDVIEFFHSKAADEVKGSGRNGRETVNATDALAVKWLCQNFFDIRCFGAVVSTGPMKGSSYGQIRGPVQFTFGKSFHEITPLEISITRCAATDAGEEEKIRRGQDRTMGNKHIVPYALYAAKGYVSPAFAERTGFTQADLDLLFGALLHMFEHDRSAARGEMVVRGLYDFEHVGTQHENNAEQNKREARLGCAHAHKLVEGIKVDLTDKAKAKGFPESFTDYDVTCEWDSKPLPKGVRLHKRHDI
ncbi:MAG: type I-C CRISPR-associated protein Cas7/Csd2 [Verrucomicrobiales bacterium]|nr:type I-C CRISPR-associated protein Cas7/Csd2 [Verrucomicrobiales bacterium]